MTASTTLGSLAEAGVLAIGDGYRTKSSEYDDAGLPILRVTDVLDGEIAPSYKDRVTLSRLPQIGPKQSRAGDVVVTTKGTVGRAALIPNALPAHVYSPQLCYLRVVDSARIDNRWLYSWVRSPHFQIQTGSVKDQTDMAPYVSLGDLRRFHIELPEIDEQRRIAEVLGALDDLIDTNERLGRRLTALAGAKGQSLLAALDDGTSATMDDIASIAKGYSYKSAELTEGTGWLVGLKNVGRRGEFRADGFKPLNAAAKPSQVVENGDLVVAHTDLTQAHEVIGRPVRVRRGNRSGTLVASLDLVVVRPNADVSVEYLQAVLESPAFREHALGYCNGTTVLHMNSRAVPSFPVAVPSVDQMRTFDELTPVRAAADDAFEAADQLRRTRDELLPLLMSGKVRVRPEEVAA